MTYTATPVSENNNNVKVVDMTNATDDEMYKTLGAKEGDVIVIDQDNVVNNNNNNNNNNNASDQKNSTTSTTTTTTVVYSDKGSIIRYIHPVCWVRRLVTGSWSRRREVVTVTKTQEVHPASVPAAATVTTPQ